MSLKKNNARNKSITSKRDSKIVEIPVVGHTLYNYQHNPSLTVIKHFYTSMRYFLH